MDVIRSLEQVSPQWLTAVLAESGALQTGLVMSFGVDPGRGNWSTNAILHLQYSAGATGTLPQRLFLKMVKIDLEDEFFGPSEVNYYCRDYLDVPDAPLIRCYHAAYSEAEQRYHLLLDDLSLSHLEAAAKEPTLEYGLALAEGLAALHARWWGRQRLAEAQAPVHPAGHIQAFVEIARPGLHPILHHFAHQLQAHWPALLRDLYAGHPQAMIQRTQNDNGFTLIHGDLGCNNILVPRVGRRPLYFIDRQPFNWSLTSWLGVYDLAYAIVLDWEIEQRRQFEIPILSHYHAQLIQRGVTNYSWEQLYDDYRLSAAMGVYIATEYCRGGFINESWLPVWLPMLQRSLTACDDLACFQLFAYDKGTDFSR